MVKDDAFARSISSAVAAFGMETVTLPCDFAKTRLQLQGQSGGQARYSGMIDCLKKTARKEGVRTYWNGLSVALIRQVSYSSLSLVLYEPILQALSPSNNVFGVSQGGERSGSLTSAVGGTRKSHISNASSAEPAMSVTPSTASRFMAGGLAGCLSISVFNWTEVIKVYGRSGIRGFWAGLQPNIVRTFLVNAAELGTFDTVKLALLPVVESHDANPFWAVLGASGCSGVISACVSTPVDVVKTRLMNQAASGGGTQYAGMGDAFVKIARAEGAKTLYQGFYPIIVRKILGCVVFFSTYDTARAAINDSEHFS